jgi:transposase-like protein
MQSYFDEYIEEIRQKARKKARKKVQKELKKKWKRAAVKCYLNGISIQVIAECLEYPEEKVISWLKAEGIQL